MHTQDFNLEDGRPVTVEYSYSPGSETTYSPLNGATGGDGCEVVIIHCWPRSEAYDDLCRQLNELRWGYLSERCFAWIKIQIVQCRIWWAERSVRLSPAEYERMEAWLIENHVYDPYEPEDF